MFGVKIVKDWEHAVGLMEKDYAILCGTDRTRTVIYKIDSKHFMVINKNDNGIDNPFPPCDEGFAKLSFNMYFNMNQSVVAKKRH